MKSLVTVQIFYFKQLYLNVLNQVESCYQHDWSELVVPHQFLNEIILNPITYYLFTQFSKNFIILGVKTSRRNLDLYLNVIPHFMLLMKS